MAVNTDNISVAKVDISNIVDQSAPAPGTPADDTLTPEAIAAAAKAAEATPADGATAPASATSPDDAPATLELTPDEIKLDPTGHDKFDVIGKMLADKNVANVNEIMDDFLETGEVSLENKAAIIEALGDSVAAMALGQMETEATAMVAEAKADSAVSMDYANKLFGQDGKQEAADTWKQIQDYSRSSESGFSESDLATMNTMLEAGGLQAQLVIDKVHSVYTADAGNSLPGTLLEGDSASNGITFTPISRADYTVAMGKAVREHGDDSPQVRDLDARRTRSMNQGY